MTEKTEQMTVGLVDTVSALEEKLDKPEPVKPFRSYYDKDGDAR